MKYLVYPDGKVEEVKHHQVNESHFAASGVLVVEADSEAQAAEKAKAGRSVGVDSEVKGEMKDEVQQRASQEQAPQVDEEAPQPKKRK